MISIIIPVYNAEKFISACLDSVVNQTYKNIEIIIINDGSTDESINIITRYSKTDGRIKVINKKNTGVSDSRNYGLSLATGRYVTFVDADDWIEEDYIKQAVDCLNIYNPDILFNGWIEDFVEYTNSRRFKRKKLIIMTKQEALIELCKQELFGWAPFGTFYSLRIAKRVELNKTICFGEDLEFKYNSIIASIGKLVYSPINKYHYVRRDTSVTINYNIAKKYDDICVIRNIIATADSAVHEILYYRELIPRELNYAFLGAVSNNKDDRDIAKRCKEDILQNWWSLIANKKIKYTTRFKLLLIISPWDKFIGKHYKRRKGFL